MYLPRHLAIPLHRVVGAGESVVLAGPRGAGKTTLARREFPGHLYLTLEERALREAARQDPVGFLGRLRRPAIVDEAQRAPGLFAALEGAKFPLVLVSSLRVQSPGRVLELYPPSRAELQRRNPLPFSVLGRFEVKEVSGNALEGWPWSMAYWEKDLPGLIRLADRDLFERYVELVGARSAEVLNQLEVARELGVSHRTVVRWQQVLDVCFQTLTIPAAGEAYGRRLIRAPKLHALWRRDCFESKVVFELYRNARHAGMEIGMEYWRDSNGLEISLLLRVEDAAKVPVGIAENPAPGWEERLTRWLALSGDASGALITQKRPIVRGRNAGWVRYSFQQL